MSRKQARFVSLVPLIVILAGLFVVGLGVNKYVDEHAPTHLMRRVHVTTTK